MSLCMKPVDVLAICVITTALLAGCVSESPSGMQTPSSVPTIPVPVTQTPCVQCTAETSFPTPWTTSLAQLSGLPTPSEILTTEVSPPPGTTSTVISTTITAITPTTLPEVVPIARFTANTTSGKVPLSVAFTDQSTGFPDRWQWDFGDGGTSTLQTPVHTYTRAGTLTVRLVAANEAGSNTETKYYYITVNPAYRSPGAAFSGIRPTNSAPMTIQFIDRSSGPATSWSWDFGDGGSSNLQNPAHTYSNPGTYTVTLRVSNPAGSSETTGFVTV